MENAHTVFSIDARGRGLYDFTRDVAAWLTSVRARTGLLTLFCRHTSASLLIQENADPAVQRDLQRFFARLAPEGARLYEHDSEGPDDMPAHIRAAVLPTSLAIPVIDGRMAIGVWQGVYLVEHRAQPHRREVAALLTGSAPAPI